MIQLRGPLGYLMLAVVALIAVQSRPAMGADKPCKLQGNKIICPDVKRKAAPKKRRSTTQNRTTAPAAPVRRADNYGLIPTPPNLAIFYLAHTSDGSTFFGSRNVSNYEGNRWGAYYRVYWPARRTPNGQLAYYSFTMILIDCDDSEFRHVDETWIGVDGRKVYDKVYNGMPTYDEDVGDLFYTLPPGGIEHDYARAACNSSYGTIFHNFADAMRYADRRR